MKQPHSLKKQKPPEEIELEKKRADLAILEDELTLKELDLTTLQVGLEDLRRRYGAWGFRLLKAVEQAGQVRTQSARVHGSGTAQVDKETTCQIKRQFVAKVRKTSQGGDFVTHNKGTFLDTRTNLMWSGEDNGFDIGWQDAKRYCENYRGGGYTDWRMPTWNELAGLYESRNYKNVIQITGLFVLASETSGSVAATFDFNSGLRCWGSQSGGGGRALPVRSGK